MAKIWALYRKNWSWWGEMESLSILSERSSPVILVPKTDTALRCCVDLWSMPLVDGGKTKPQSRAQPWCTSADSSRFPWQPTSSDGSAFLAFPHVQLAELPTSCFHCKPLRNLPSPQHLFYMLYLTCAALLGAGVFGCCLPRPHFPWRLMRIIEMNSFWLQWSSFLWLFEERYIVFWDNDLYHNLISAEYSSFVKEWKNG